MSFKSEHGKHSLSYDLNPEQPRVTVGYRPQFAGTVTPPPDMIDAARKSLDAEGFEELMRETGGRAPTPDELVAKVEARRAA